MPRGNFNDAGYKPAGGQDVNNDHDDRLVQGTEEQEAIWQYMLRDTGHAIVEAVAGSGKTFTIVQYAMREKKARVGLVAFNRHIKQELSERVGRQSNIECMTYHSLGYRAVRETLKRKVDVDAHKTLVILDGMRLPGLKGHEARIAKYRISSLVSYCKSMGHSPDVTRDELEKLVDRFDLDLSQVPAEMIYEFTPRVLSRCMDELATVDYDDQVWLPMVMNMAVPRFDMLCVDEYQDTGTTQQWLAIRAASRLCAVGDPRQAIYAFRGADSRGFDRLRQKLGSSVVTFPLTLTRRCPKNHVRLAQSIVPQIQAMDNAPDGIVRVVATVDKAVAEMKPGDLVVCRVNAELVATAYKLMKRGVRALVRGKDLGDGLIKLLDDATGQARDVGTGEVTVRDIVAVAGDITGEQVRKYLAMPNGRGEMRAANSVDRYDCLSTLAQAATTIQELRNTIIDLFDDQDQQAAKCVTLGTVHRTKGLEGNRVFILRPDLIPHPMAKKREDKESEQNLGYVAVTRAKYSEGQEGELIFVGDISPLFRAAATGIVEVDNTPAPVDVEMGEGWLGNEDLVDPALGENDIPKWDTTVVQEPDETEDQKHQRIMDELTQEGMGADVPEHRRWKN